MLIFAYLLIGIFFAIEGRLRQGPEAKSLETGQFDRGSTRGVAYAFAITLVLLILAPILNYFRVAVIGSVVIGIFGLALMIIGLALRYWAFKALGAFYTRTLLVKTTHHIVDNGPYRVIRNPGYLGNIFLFVGAGLAASNWIIVVVISIVLLASYHYRIRVEEKMLQTAFGDEFQAYKTRTWKLIPLLY